MGTEGLLSAQHHSRCGYIRKQTNRADILEMEMNTITGQLHRM